LRACAVRNQKIKESRSSSQLARATVAKPIFAVVAGPNGAGKSSLVKAYPLGFQVLNPDELARLASGRSATKLIHAGRAMRGLVNKALAAGDSFGVETTLAGQHILALMERAKSEGFSITLLYVGIDSLDLSKLRIGDRMALGGHGVPEPDVERRFPRSFANLRKALAIADDASLFDNSLEAGHRLIARKRGSTVEVFDDSVDWLRQALSG
jgi:predicted ABC-type ATPase